MRIAGRERLYAASAEDYLLRKLLWFRDGGGVSNRPWRDVLGILRVSGPGLDRLYLQQWAVRLGVKDLLDRGVRSDWLGVITRQQARSSARVLAERHAHELTRWE